MKKRGSKHIKAFMAVVFLAAVCFAFAWQAPTLWAKVKSIKKESPPIVQIQHTPEAAVPEPATVALVGLGGAALAYKRSKNRKRDSQTS